MDIYIDQKELLKILIIVTIAKHCTHNTVLKSMSKNLVYFTTYFIFITTFCYKVWCSMENKNKYIIVMHRIFQQNLSFVDGFLYFSILDIEK